MNTPENTVKKQIDKLLKAYEFVEVPITHIHYPPPSSVQSGPPMSYALEAPYTTKIKLLWWYKPNAGAYGRAGIPDYIGCLAGKMFGIEAKANGNRLTKLQEVCVGQIREALGRVFIIHGQTGLTRQILLNQEYAELEEWLKEEHAAYKARNVMGISQDV